MIQTIKRKFRENPMLYYALSICATWAGIGNALIGSLLAWVILGRRTRIMTQHLKSHLVPQFILEVK